MAFTESEARAARNRDDAFARAVFDEGTVLVGRSDRPEMDRLTLFGLFAVTAMVICYALEHRSRGFVLAFAASCVLASVYGFLQGAWPFGVVEALWSGVAAYRWAKTANRAAPPAPG